MAARSLFGALKHICSATSGNLTGSIVLRRSYVATSQNVTATGLSKGGSTRVMVGKIEQRALDQEAESAWGPDPVTGYYRPSDRAAEIDPAELRELLLKNKSKSF
ncbi:PREDICTED: late embryogenesis abundant protein Lea5-like [Camelina sativa]|uniref:Late embryogenesis abundant protein Lea5-like n=1 Tax=Camelina sativa TaxID=90675 RepID=A0ABM0V2M7_CAMSA|nr:PREDICTED: late embryogenesis abundant protein Lea5-like [Camelina sativa]